ncbi:MAG TPA: SBBP repeat-containing protein [Pyrinomonadaceae bacterium]|nr:SBBP repeat-containing protein [Pyrinomonadaceae bacterium]
MISLTRSLSRINYRFFLIGFAFVIATLASVIYVAAGSDDSETSATRFVPAATDASKAKLAERFGQLPLSFETNKGQTDSTVKFLSHGPGYDLFLTGTEAVLSLQKYQTQPIDNHQPPASPNTPVAGTNVREGSVVRLKMIGANADPRVEGEDELPGKVNYFTGNDPEKWTRNIPTYRRVHYKNIYQGIDIVYYGNQHELEYDFVVAAGANPKLIKFSVAGAERMRLDQDGNLILTLKHGEAQLKKPFIYQLTDDGSRREVKGSYVIDGKVIRFNVRGADSGKPLVIDPVLSYSTYLGGRSNEQAVGIAVDAQGNAYVTGTTQSSIFPTTAGAFKRSDFGGAFVTKLDPTGSSLVYSTFLNGTGGSDGLSIALDAAGNAHITGSTTTNDFPVVNGLKTSANLFKTIDSASNWNNNNTGLVGELNAIAVAPSAPNTIYAGTQHGPFRSTDAGATWTKTPTTGLPTFLAPLAIAVDSANAAVVYVGLGFDGVFKSTDGGNNWSTVNVPVNGGGVFTIVIDPSNASTVYVGSSRGVFKSTNSGSTWTAINNFGPSGIPFVRALAVDPTTPTTIYAGTNGNGGFFKSTDGGLNWTVMNTGLSGGSFSVVNAIVIDASNPATIYAGHGFSGVGGGISKSINGGVSWTQVNNGVPNTEINALVRDRSNNATLYAATTTAGILKTINGGDSWTSANTGFWKNDVHALVAHPSDSTILYAGTRGTDSRDGFVAKLNSSGSDLLFSTYLGGSANDVGNGIAVDSNGNIYVVGQTTSRNFPTANAVQPAFSVTENCTNGFVTKLNPSTPAYVFSTFLSGSKCDTANSVALDQAGNAYVTGNTGSSDFPKANPFQPALGDTFFGDAFVTKLNSTGSLTYSTYLGGNGSDTGFSVAVDVSGNAYITGVTSSTNFPTANPIQANNAGSGEVFVTKLNSSGSALVYSTYLGGSASDTGRGIAVDASGNAYLTGFTSSLDFPSMRGAIRTRSALSKSVDGAANWSNDNYGIRPSLVTHLAIHPTQPSTLYAGAIGGAFKSTDAGKTWTAINNGLTSFPIVGLVIDPLTPSTLYIATSNDFGGTGGIYKSTDGGSSWNLRVNGMTNTRLASLAIDPVTPSILYAGASGGPIYKTTNGADNWSPVGNVPPFFPVYLAVDPHTHTRIFAVESSTAGGVFRSIDSGATWQSVGLAQTGPHGNFVTVSPLTPNLVYASTNLGLFKSVDGGDNWSSVRPQGFGRVVFDPINSSTLYLISSAEGVLKSTDNGQTWIPMNKGLNVPRAAVLAINPLKNSILYLGTESTFDEDAFVTKINPAGSALLYSTVIGGIPAPSDSLNTNDEAFGIALDQAGNSYITGVARSPSFPTTPNSFQPFNLGFSDAFISKVTMSHMISGHVFEAGGAPLSDAEVVLSDGASVTSVVTETDGSYEFARLREGGSFTVSASRPHFTMAPASQSFNNLNSDQVLNFTATATNASFFTISGQVTNSSAGLAGVTVTLSGSQLGTRTTDANGNYSFEVAGSGNYIVTPAVLGFSFGPSNQTFNNVGASQTANFAATRQSFVVTNTNNHGTGSLREAITNANAVLGADTITFNIPGADVKVINLVNPLPDITEPVVIDGSTQPGYAGSPLIQLDGASLDSGERGLVILAGGTTVRGLAIGGFRGPGIEARSCNNNVIQGNYLGVDASGSSPRPNGFGISLSQSSNNVIGGTTAATRNVISGNTSHGVEILGQGNVVQGNFIGANAAGTIAIANDKGIHISGASSTNNLIGGTVAGAGNLISGNQQGIFIEAPGNTIQGNLIGTDVTGSNRIPNSNAISASSQNTLIGGLTPGARNIISGNNGGVIFGENGSKLQGNFIGTDITGTIALGNGDAGVNAIGPALVGGLVPEARNVIAANENANVRLISNGSGQGATVQGNYIGIDVTGNKALTPSPATTTFDGIAVFSSNNLIGGVVSGAQNVISGNFVGVSLSSSVSVPPNGNVIQGNLIGLNALGTAPIGNVQGGIEFSFDAFDNTVGGTQAGAANKIAFNGFRGVAVANAGARNSIRGNSIFSNGGLGIDLGVSGVTPNDDGDLDAGGNTLQNFPVLTSVTSSNNSTTIQGSLNSTPNTIFQIDFYSSAALDPSGNGEGALFFATTPVTTDGSGNATINATIPMALGPGRVITATATDPSGNTSEFSAGDATSATGSAQFAVNSIQVIEDVGVASVTVLRLGGSTGNLTVGFTTVDLTAIAGQDYTSTSGTLSFANGETSKTIQVPILEDGDTEPDEFFMIALRNASNLESLSEPTTVLVTLQDRTTVPFVSVENRFIREGDSGSITETFIASVSAQTGRTITVNYMTSDISASGGASCNNQGTDYETTAGTLTFQPRNTLLSFQVKICGDTSAEANETFLLNLSDQAGELGFFPGLGTILDDDVMQLLLEESGPGPNPAAAIDELLFLRDPFRVVTIPEHFANGNDRNTRLMLFVKNLQLNPGEASSAVVVRLRNSNFQLTDVPAEDVRRIPNVDFTQVIMRLPDNLLPGNYSVMIRAHSRISNTGVIRIAP